MNKVISTGSLNGKPMPATLAIIGTRPHGYLPSYRLAV